VKLKNCPACEGKGVVPVIFKPETPVWVVNAKFPREYCELCNGTGLITKEKYYEYKKVNRRD